MFEDSGDRRLVDFRDCRALLACRASPFYHELRLESFIELCVQNPIFETVVQNFLTVDLVGGVVVVVCKVMRGVMKFEHFTNEVPDP